MLAILNIQELALLSLEGFEKMKRARRIYGFVFLFVMLLNLDGATSRNFPLRNTTTTTTNNIQGYVKIQANSSTPIEGVVEREGKYKQLKKLGSKPPSCEHKCYGCKPCEAIQVPTTTHFGVLYTNYEPEGWKCKCGPTFYSP
ncbi:EPIDERMAL PATTERNING FACTOR-like protein 6 [Salvia splendens]|uniref:EPIDERMAL PATTERNING FACTOR-like protein 6 n=1 Tax=Salvia splendens TaxID=180675 RepID=UPI001C25D239|nr:EPIDERMAL PATTERNING FACTOR-like protein 6 [Salvia splendens]